METFDPLQVTEGDSLRYVTPMTGDSRSITVYGVKGCSPEGGSVYTDYIQKPDGQRVGVFLRHIRSDWVTHHNRLRIAQTSRQEPKQSSKMHSEAQEQLMLTIEEKANMAEKVHATTRKSLNEMSEAHRKHIEKWDPHLAALKGEHVWASVNRIPGRGKEGPVYVALKRGAKDYAIVDYDTAKQVAVTPKRILADGFESSSALMEAFKDYRQKAKSERLAAREADKKPAAKKVTKSVAKKATKKATKSVARVAKPAK